MRKRITNIIITLSMILLLSGCSAKDDKVSDAAEGVVKAMFTAPNPELYDPDAVTVIGEGQDEGNAAENKKIEDNWEVLVGKYFEEGRLEYFISTYGLQYLTDAALENKEISVKEIELVNKTDTSETVLIKYLDGATEKEEKIYFQYDQEGLIRDVKPSDN
ncbi:MAG: hypothetical protein SPJ92_08135 [Bariatricus sp.]|nr:hypothetical protein [Bariatricus sp.]